MSLDDFEKLATKKMSPILLVELWQFLRQTKKWWLFPVVVTLLMVVLPAGRLAHSRPVSRVD